MRLALRATIVTAGIFMGSLLIAPLLSHPCLPFVYASAASDRAAGRVLFHEKGCEHCHGVGGIGGEKGPDLSGVGRKLKADEIRTQILHGGDAMPSFADVLAPDEVKLLVESLSAKKKLVKTKQTPASPALPVAKPSSGGSDDQ